MKRNWKLPCPGETIQDILTEKSMTRQQFAEKMGVCCSDIEGLLNGTVQIDFPTAYGLSMVVGSSVEFWLQLDINYWREKERA